MGIKAESIAVEVAYATPTEQVLLSVQVPPGARVCDAIVVSGILQRFPQINPAVCRVGIFGRLVSLNEPLNAGDRVEIYRELEADPKTVRRQRAATGRSRIRRG